MVQEDLSIDPLGILCRTYPDLIAPGPGQRERILPFLLSDGQRILAAISLPLQLWCFMARIPSRSFPRQLFEKLSKQECQSALEVVHYAAQAETSQEVREVLVRFQTLFPFNRLLGGLARLGPGGTFQGFTNVINVSYPDEWLRLYWQNSYYEVDPVFKSALQSPGTRHWKAAYAGASSEEERGFIQAAREFGLGDGITTASADKACGIATFCSFAGMDGIEAERYLKLVEYLGHHLHLALMRAEPRHASVLDKCVKQLSVRELTILNWMKNGKTNWEIAQILGVTERTIRFHVESIFSKLDVTSRSQAVATALEHGLPNLHGLPTAI
jgi:LuxR family transcriptional regulator, quorum-sensing system regulator CviR